MKLLNEDRKKLSVVRKEKASHEGAALQDFINILEDWGIYRKENYIKTPTARYELGSSLIEFIGSDNPRKKRGAKRDYLFINEGNELTKEDWFQLYIRTSSTTILDFNPSDEYHFIYDDIIPMKNAAFLKTTYKDNPFLENTIIEAIEGYKEQDNNYWKIYGLGERGLSQATIFDNWKLDNNYDNRPGTIVYGLDFGYNDPTAMVEVKQYDNDIYVKECFFQSYLTSEDIIKKVKSHLYSENSEVICDSARPEIIEDMCRAGINAHPSRKGKNSVKDSIDYLKIRKIYLEPRSNNLIKEVKMYKWKIRLDETVTDEPVDLNNHGIDALRYAVYRDDDKFVYAIV